MDARKRKLRRWVLASGDLWQVADWVRLLLEEKLYEEKDDRSRLVSRGLHTAMVTAYCRVFLKNYDDGQTAKKLDDNFLDEYTDDQRRFHTRVVRMRHGAFAHSDPRALSLKVEIADLGGIPIALPISSNPYYSWDREHLEQFQEMVGTLQCHLDAKIIAVQGELSVGDSF